MIIVIDGPSGTGKSTIAKEVARSLGFTFFDTGAMYRSFAWKVLQEQIDPANEDAVVSLIHHFDFKVCASPQGDRLYFVGGTEVTDLIRSREISLIASKVSAYAGVRKQLVKMQRRLGRKTNAVFEGRDMGTVVFPDADLKIFLTADPAVRADRRYRELLVKFPDLSGNFNREQILQEINERDENDRTREVSPLKQAADATLIDTSHMTIRGVVDEVIRLQSKLTPPRMKFSYWIVYTLARSFFKLFFRLRVYGDSHIRKGAGLIIANHTSFFDPPVLSISCPEEVHFLARESLFRIPLLGRIIRMLNTHPLSKDAGDLAVFRRMVALLGEKKKLILFPEGKRSTDGQILPFQRGLAFLAEKAKCPIFPAYLDGVFEAWPQGRKFPRLFGKITCVFGSPIEWDEFEELPKKQAEELLLERSRKAVEDLRNWLKSGAHGAPP